MTSKPGNITRILPAKCTLTVQAATCKMTKTSSMNEMKLVMTQFKAGDADLNYASLSVLTIRCQRKRKVQTGAKEIRDNFSFFKKFDNSFLVIKYRCNKYHNNLKYQ